MNCEICGKRDPKVKIILPLKQLNGKLETSACETCARNSTAYCEKHDRIHQGFIDGTTACISCIEESVKLHAEMASDFRGQLFRILSRHERQELKEAAELSSLVTGSPQETSILRFLVTKAKRDHQTIYQILEKVREKKSVRFMLW